MNSASLTRTYKKQHSKLIAYLMGLSNQTHKHAC